MNAYWTKELNSEAMTICNVEKPTMWQQRRLIHLAVISGYQKFIDVNEQDEEKLKIGYEKAKKYFTVFN